MPRRIDLGRAVLFAGSALLFVSLFLRWYDTGPTGWEVFEALDLVLAALAVAGMVASVRPDTTAPWAAAGVPGAALLIVFVQLVNAPPAAGGGDPSSGAWLALAGAFLMAAGAALSLAAISVTIQVRERDLRRRVTAVDHRRGASDDDLAEDLDADAEGPVASEPRVPSLFSGLGRRDDRGDDIDESDEPPLRSGRITAREAAGEEAPRAHDLERTQPMSALPDEEDAERP
ncbi:hypothetical protein DSM104299_05617 [Baekduia alba]|uniref:hypothetical protein n=1 Tax=Baekduia alba TaxID=2997333 RepID=UPI00233FC93E|nr:hypothetical protein [Baekduia alba]WCB96849.1 hypothetical protein DSM104299_05617 [Baekduia alba]